MAWNHNRRCANFRKVRFGCANLAIDAASGRVVDKGIVAIPERVSGVQNISLGKVYRDVRIGMGGARAGSPELSSRRVRGVVTF